MTETVVHVTTLEQWKSVLDVWFKQGYEWASGEKDYKESYFTNENSHYLALGDLDIFRYSQRSDIPSKIIEYSEFTVQQKEDNKMAMVYEVSQSVFDELQRIKAHEGTSLIGAITLNAQLIKSIGVGNKAILRYLADDPAIEFKPVKEQLYRLWATDENGERVYFYSWQKNVSKREFAFTAPLGEITEWQTPVWEIEKVDD